MADAWGGSWGSSWGSSWGGAPVVTVGRRFCLDAFDGKWTELIAPTGKRFNLAAVNAVPAAMAGIAGKRTGLDAFDSGTLDLTATNQDCGDSCG